MSSIQDRIIRAAKLDAKLYEEVEADQGAMGQAIAVVVLSGVAAGIGNSVNGGLSESSLARLEPLLRGTSGPF